MYFRFSELHDWGKRSGSCRRRFIQSFPNPNERPAAIIPLPIGYESGYYSSQRLPGRLGHCRGGKGDCPEMTGNC